MKITVPHMGHISIALEALLQEMGHEVIVPPECSNRTLSLGTKYSPETVCLPLKINIGNFLEAIELGAEAILMAGGVGPCRFGYYAEVQRIILEDLGKEVELIVLEPPQENFGQLIGGIRRLFAPRGVASFWRGLRLCWAKLNVCEKLLTASHYARCRQLEPHQVSRTLKRGFQAVRQGQSERRLTEIEQEYLTLLEQQGAREITPLRIGIVGEIYTVVEPFVNLQLEERLGELGVEVFRSISLVEWVKDHLIRSSLGLYSDKKLREKASGYLRGFVGGHGLESVAHSVELAEKGFDGIIHLLPLTCMPEIVAQSILPLVSEDYSIPLLTLVVDEHTGVAGFHTRLEAFVDLLQRRDKEELVGEEFASVSGS